MTDTSDNKLADLLLDHIGRYRISFPQVMEKVYGAEGNVAASIKALQEDGLIKSLGKAEGYGRVFANHTAYQITKTGAAQAGVTPKRAKNLNENALEPSFRVLWLCCMGEIRFSLLEETHMLKLFGNALGVRNNAYCMEIEGERRVYRIRLIGQNMDDLYALRNTRKDFENCAEIPRVKDFVERGRYGNILAVSKPERRKRLEERINEQGLNKLGLVQVALVPDLIEIKEVMRA